MVSDTATLDTLLETTDDPIVVLDTADTIVDCNEPARASTPGVTIRVGTFSEGFYVADDGPGIPADDRETVFEQGYTTADEGTGLGLAIVDRIADGHGWEVTVTDSETGGARFEVWTNGRPEASKSEADTDVSGS
jgi:nitrogen fixation/metabolism regulation signal transduction histidine kinase